MPDKDISKIQELVYELKVRDVTKKKTIKITPSTQMSKLRELLRENRISGTPVVEDGELVGIISMEDFINWLGEGGPRCTVAERMTRKVMTVFEDEPLIQAVNKFERFGFGRLPVLKRETGTLVGIITKGDIIAGMLDKLDIGFRQAEMTYNRSDQIFKEMVADKKALILEYQVSGGNFAQAGSSASGLKTTLLHIGISPQIARRVAIATYEAEMNLIFFTDGGKIIANIDPHRIMLDVKDDGPGIPDIDQAMKPGYSTAPDWVRELGFGAGMGLCNIRMCADRMSLISKVGGGTRIEVDILLKREDKSARDPAEASV